MIKSNSKNQQKNLISKKEGRKKLKKSRSRSVSFWNRRTINKRSSSCAKGPH